MRTGCAIAMMAALAAAATADDLTLMTGEVVTGKCVGFTNHRFVFQQADGAKRREFAAAIKALRVEPPVKVSAQFVNERFDDTLFAGYEAFNVRLIKNGRESTEPATMLKQIDLTLAFDANRILECPHVYVISKGEDVDLNRALRTGQVNVVHFHSPQVLASVREGNYIEVLAGQSQPPLVVLKVVVPGWGAPVCKTCQLKSLPQFWFYSSSGKLVKKVTDRFTESDIDDALKEARGAL